MAGRLLLIASLFSCSALVVGHPALHQPSRHDSPRSTSNGQQHPITGAPVDSSPAGDSVSSPSWPIYWQDDRTCRAKTTQFTGTVPVSNGNGLFFWFFESRNKPLASPTILWLNGGPGSSSLPGLFEEIGPCMLDPDNSTGTVENVYSWANYANILILDQPAGVGFSPLGKGSTLPKNLKESSVDFSLFLERFTERYPEYFRHGFHIAGESFGGQYVPRYVHDIIRREREAPAAAAAAGAGGRAPSSTSFLVDSIRSIILVDPAVDLSYGPLGHYELFCTGAQHVLEYNSTTCADIAAQMPEAERLQRLCHSTLEPRVCQSAVDFGMDHIFKYLEEEMDAGRHSPYDIRLKCEMHPICVPPSAYAIEPYLSNPDIQSLLGVDKGHGNFSFINEELNEGWSNDPAVFVPTTKELVYLLDEAKLQVLVMNGNYDAGITTAGIFREFDELPWSKGIRFRLSKTRDWNYLAADRKWHKGGTVKGLEELRVVGIDDAGHMSPGDQKEAVSLLIRDWLVSPINQGQKKRIS